jgi:hypothetical protein
VLVEVENDAEACDAISEALRPMLREFYEGDYETAWIDWRYADNASHPVPHSGEGFEYANPGSTTPVEPVPSEYIALATSHGATFAKDDVGGAWAWYFEGDNSIKYGVGPFDTQEDAAIDLCAERGWKPVDAPAPAAGATA